MAGGMAKVVMNTFEGPSLKKGTTEHFEVDLVKGGESVEMKALTEEKSNLALQILQERQIASNPMKAYAKVCANQMNGDEDGAQSQLKTKNENMSPMMRILVNLMPILTWLPKLNAKIVRSDLIAGITVGVMVIPQSMSYGAIAGLPYINGMYSACIPTLVYALFGQSRQLAVGPVAMVSLLVEAGLRGQLSEEDCPQWYAEGGENSGKAQYEVCPKQYVNLACLTAMVVGGMQIVGSILRLGFLVSFLGHPVTSGFTSGAAIIIGLSQLKYILGYDMPKSQYVYDTINNIFQGIGGINFMTVFLGVVTLGYLITNKKIVQKYPRFRMAGPLGPLVCCVFGSILIIAFPQLYEDFHVKYVGEIPDGIMPMSLFGFHWKDIPKVMPTALSSCLIGYMESIAIGKNLASKHKYEIEAGQEMLALGIANVIGSAFSCYPVTGSFSRSAVNNQTGALSQLSGVVTGLFMFLTLMLLTPLFKFLPKFVLAAIVLNSVIPLVAFSEAKHLWRVKRQDFLLWVVAFLGTLFLGVLMGIVVAVSLSLIIVIYESVRPQLTILWRIPGTTIYRNMKQESSGAFIPNVFICRIGSSMYFANASFVKDMLLTYVSDLDEVNPTEYLVLEMTPVVSIDSTACHVIHDIVSSFRSRGIEVAFAMVGNRVDKTMRKAGLKTFIGDKWLFATVNEAVQYCLRHQHAKKLRCLNDDPEAGVKEEKADGLDVTTIGVGFSNEIGFSNDLHSEFTMVFITLSQDVPMIMSEITAIFKRSQLTIIRAQIEPLADDGAKHTYFLKSIRTDSKLSEREMDRLREDLQAMMKKHVPDIYLGGTESCEASRRTQSTAATSMATASSEQLERIAKLEKQLDQLLAIKTAGKDGEKAGARRQQTVLQQVAKQMCSCGPTAE